MCYVLLAGWCLLCFSFALLLFSPCFSLWRLVWCFVAPFFFPRGEGRRRRRRGSPHCPRAPLLRPLIASHRQERARVHLTQQARSCCYHCCCCYEFLARPLLFVAFGGFFSFQQENTRLSKSTRNDSRSPGGRSILGIQTASDRCNRKRAAGR